MDYAHTKRKARAGSMIVEMSAVLGISIMLLVLFHMSMVSVSRLVNTAEAHNRGLVVLGNVVERLEAVSPVSEEEAARVLTEEFEHSGFAGSAYYVPLCEWTREGLDLSIVDPEGDALVAVRLGS